MNWANLCPLIHVLDILGPLNICACVCKAWNKVANQRIYPHVMIYEDAHKHVLSNVRTSFIKILFVHECDIDVNFLDSNFVLEDMHMQFSTMTNLSALKSEKLHTLHMHKCNISDNDLMNVISKLTSLTQLDLTQNNITSEGINALTKLEELRVLRLVNIEQLGDISSLANLKSLEYLDLSLNKNIMNIGSLSVIKSLRTLELCYSGIDDDVFHVVQLEHLNINYCTKVTGKNFGLKSLRSFELSGCVNFDYKQLASLTKLEVLNLRRCSITNDDMKIVKGLVELRDLKLDNCEKLNDDSMKMLSGLERLEILCVNKCYLVENVYNIGLRQLDLSECKVTDEIIANLCVCVNLKILLLMKCAQIKGWGPSKIKSLQRLNLRECTNLDDVSILTLCELPLLDFLWIHGFGNRENSSVRILDETFETLISCARPRKLVIK